MYFDVKPCRVCGSEVTLTARRPEDEPPVEGHVGQPGGYVGDGDSTVDARVCTNPDCPTNTTDHTTDAPRP